MKKLLLLLMTILGSTNNGSAQEPQVPQGIEAFTLTFVDGTATNENTIYQYENVNSVIAQNSDKVKSVSGRFVTIGLKGRGAKFYSGSYDSSMTIELEDPIVLEGIGINATTSSDASVNVAFNGSNDYMAVPVAVSSDFTFSNSCIPLDGKRVSSITILRNKQAQPLYVNAITFYVPKLSISSVGYSTYYNSGHAFVMPENVEGYVYYYDTQNHFEKAYDADVVVPANTALVLKGAEGNYPLYLKDEGGVAPVKNNLLGTDTATELDEDSSSYFYALTLNGDSDPESVGFYWMNDDGTAFTNGAHKAYLKLDKNLFADGQAKRAFRFDDSNIATFADIAIGRLEQSAAYNINGQRVPDNAKGLVIRNGKKCIR